MKKTDALFTVEAQYQLFLKRMALTEASMHPDQKKQLRQAFYGAWGQCLFLQKDEMQQLQEGEQVEVYEAQVKEMGEYWKTQLPQN
jgi:hypothetical protein